jgi:hypothetical protein
MISTIFIDTGKERLFPMAGNTREAVTEFVKNQIDLSFVALCNTSTIKQLAPELTEGQAETVLSRLLTIPSVRRENLWPYEWCVDEIFERVQNKEHFIISGWSQVYKHEKLPNDYNHRVVVHSFGESIEREFRNVCAAVAHAPFVEGQKREQTARVSSDPSRTPL